MVKTSSCNGTWIAVIVLVAAGIILASWGLLYWFTPIQPITTIQAHPEPIEAIYFSPDSALITTVPNLALRGANPWNYGGSSKTEVMRGVGGAATVKQWDWQTATSVQEFSDPLGLSDVLVFSPGLEILAGQNRQGFGALTIAQWDAQGTALAPFTLSRLSSSLIPRHSFSEDGQRVAVMRYAPEQQWAVEIWDVVAQEQVQRLQVQWLNESPGTDVRLAFRPTQPHHLLILQANIISLWDVGSGRQLAKQTFEEVNHVLRYFGFSDDGEWLWVRSSGGLERWNLTSNERQSPIPLACSTSVTVSSDARRLACLQRPDNYLRLYDLETGDRLLDLPDSEFASVALHPQGDWLALVQTEERQVQIRSGATGELVTRLDLSQAPGLVSSASFSDDGQTLIVYHYSKGLRIEDDQITLWNPATGEALGTQPDPRFHRSFQTQGITLEPTFADNPKITSLWEAASGRLLAELDDADLQLVGFNEAQARLITTAGSTVQLWNATTGERQQTLTMAQGQPSQLATAANGRVLAAGNRNFVQVWNLETAETIQTINVSDRGQVRALALSPNGDRLAIDQSNHLLLINTHTGRSIASVSYSSWLPNLRRWWNETSWPSGCVAFSPDGKRLALRVGREIWLMRGSNGRVIRKIKLEPDNSGNGVPRSLAFSPDGRLLAMGDYGGSLHLWQLPRVLSLF